ncbi:TPA: hypothetical protein I7730_00415 [Vibrio vulnificus]|uniref:Uncharacterized protein n=1 Tax=Vibrio vulnificus TaxID=672 RepID=A0A8H9K6X5_VIBVL|nr:hypothetical protein [Vibrio vulnificus]HAS8538262.1 hypothetical protein [Vibrio vulnificus]
MNNNPTPKSNCNPSNKPNLNLSFLSISESAIRSADLQTFFCEMIATKDSLILANQEHSISELEKLLFLPSGYIECIRGIWDPNKGAQVVIDLLCPILGNRLSITVIKKISDGYLIFISKYRSDLNAQPDQYYTEGSVKNTLGIQESVLNFRFTVVMGFSVLIGERNSIHLHQKYSGISVEAFNTLGGVSETMSFCGNMVSSTNSLEEAKATCKRLQSLGFVVGAITNHKDRYQVMSALPSGFPACPASIANLLEKELSIQMGVLPEFTGFIMQIQPMITRIKAKINFEITMHNSEELEAMKSLLRSSSLVFSEEKDSLVTTKLLIERVQRSPVW